mgnify:CR=1 FL=1
MASLLPWSVGRSRFYRCVGRGGWTVSAPAGRDSHHGQRQWWRQQLSLADCAGFVVMEQNAITTALAFDDDFRREGFTVLESVEHLDRL